MLFKNNAHRWALSVYVCTRLKIIHHDKFENQFSMLLPCTLLVAFVLQNLLLYFLSKGVHIFSSRKAWVISLHLSIYISGALVLLNFFPNFYFVHLLRILLLNPCAAAVQSLACAKYLLGMFIRT